MASIVTPFALHDAYVEDSIHMSTTFMLRVLEHSQQCGSKKLLLLAIARFANDDGTGATPSIATLARLIGTKTRNVQYLLRDLEASGELICEQHAGPEGCNRYTVVLPSSAEPALDITDVQWDADPPLLPPAPPAHSLASQQDAARCTQLKEREKDGGGDHTHARKDVGDEPVPTPPSERPLHAAPYTLWQTGRVTVQSLDMAQLQTLAADLDEPTGGYGSYWLGRAILAANVCDAEFATNPRALNLVRAILRRWTHEHSYGSDTRAYQSKLESRNVQSRPTEQRLAAPRGRPAYQPRTGTPRSHGPSASRSPAITTCTIVGYDPDGDG